MENGQLAALPRVSVVVPARNEAKNLPYVLGALPAGLHEVILVDGGSVDDTVAVARDLRPGIKVVQQTRRGKGNALACGFGAVTGDVVVMLDADGSADPAEIPAFVAALTGGADFAKGTRFACGGGSHDITRFRRVGNSALNLLVNLLFGTAYTDLCYGYNAFWAYMLDRFDLPPVHLSDPTIDRVWGDGFEIETLLNVRIAAAGARITEVGSVEKVRLHGESNLNAVTDGLRVLRTIMAERLRARRRSARLWPAHRRPEEPTTVDLRATDANRTADGHRAADVHRVSEARRGDPAVPGLRPARPSGVGSGAITIRIGDGEVTATSPTGLTGLATAIPRTDRIPRPAPIPRPDRGTRSW
jgi:Glycosyl transferase family 2